MYRTVIEVLKWTEAKTVLGVAHVSRLWRGISSSEELWYSLLEAEGLQVEDLEQVLSTAQACYRELIITRHLVLFRDESLYLYDCMHATFERSYPCSSTPFKESCAVAFVPPQSVFVCCLTGTAQMRLSEGTFESLDPMLYSRQYHSIVACNASVYAFGGVYCRSAERFHLGRKVWVQLPDMSQCRSHFNACRKGKVIYLCGGDTSDCETFRVDSETYAALPLRVTNTSSVSFFYKDQLLCLAGETVYWVTGNRVEVMRKRMALASWGNQAPVAMGSRVYVTMFECKNILEIRMDSLSSRPVCST